MNDHNRAVFKRFIAVLKDCIKLYRFPGTEFVRLLRKSKHRLALFSLVLTRKSSPSISHPCPLLLCVVAYATKHEPCPSAVTLFSCYPNILRKTQKKALPTCPEPGGQTGSGS